MPPDVPIQDVLFTVFQSIFQVFLLCLAGFMLSFKGIVDKHTSKVLNHINVALFTPALLFSKVAFFLTPAKLRQLWVIPIFFTVLTGLSAVIAHWLARALHLKRSQVNFATAASMFMNSNSLPVALMQSLATTVSLLKWGLDDTVDAMFGRSLTYLVVFSTLGMILRWSYGIHLISQADEPESTTIPSTMYRDADDTDRYPAFTHVTVDPPTTTQLVDYEIEANTKLRDRMPRHTRLTPVSLRHTHLHMHLRSHLPAVPTSLGDQSESEYSDEFEITKGDLEDAIAPLSEPHDTGLSTEVEDPAPTPTPAPVLSSSPSVHPTPRWDRESCSSLKRLFIMLASLSPPLVASLLSIFCVLVPPVQRLLNSDEMIPFKGALNDAGACSIPLTMLVLGGWFWDGETKRKGTGGSDGRGDAKCKGKSVKNPHHSHGDGTCAVPTFLGEQHGQAHTSTTENIPRLGHHMTSHSCDSSTTSLSSMISAVGDVLMTHIRLRVGSNAGARKDDVEPGLLATHTETTNENAENGLGHASRARSQMDPVNGCSLTSGAAPKSLHARGMNPPGETLTVFVALIVRMVIVPLIVTPMMVLAIRLGWGGHVFEDPVFIVSCMLLVSSPPALTLAQISQRVKGTTGTGAGSDTNKDVDGLSPFERLLSRTVFWAYCVLTPPVTIASVMVGLLSIGA